MDCQVSCSLKIKVLSCHENKLLKIKPTLGEWTPAFRNSRREEVILSRLRIGHTYFSHSFILRKEDPPECIACQEAYSVKHVLIDCTDYKVSFLPCTRYENIIRYCKC